MSEAGGVPPDIGPALVRPVTCRKCQGSGIYTRASGMPDVCAPCNGSGYTEGDQRAVATRRARQELITRLYRDASAHSIRATNGFHHLREFEPDRFERALASYVAGRDVVSALHQYDVQREEATNPNFAARNRIRSWVPPVDGLDEQATAYGQAERVSAAFTVAMNQAGLRARWVRLEGSAFPRPTADPRWLETPHEQWVHYVTVVTVPGYLGRDGNPGPDEELLVDWTLRQFGQLSHPWVDDRARSFRMWNNTVTLPDGAAEEYLAAQGGAPQPPVDSVQSGSPSTTGGEPLVARCQRGRPGVPNPVRGSAEQRR